MKNAAVRVVDDAVAALHVFHRVLNQARCLGSGPAARAGNGDETTSVVRATGVMQAASVMRAFLPLEPMSGVPRGSVLAESGVLIA